MKLLVAVIVGVILACIAVNGHVPVKLNDEQKSIAAKIAIECISQEKATTEAVKLFSQGDFSKADRNLKCYSNCFLTKAGILVDGVVQPAVVKEKLGPSVEEEKLKTTMAICGGLKGSDNCETAFMMFECYHKEHADIV